MVDQQKLSLERATLLYDELIDKGTVIDDEVDEDTKLEILTYISGYEGDFVTKSREQYGDDHQMVASNLGKSTFLKLYIDGESDTELAEFSSDRKWKAKPPDDRAVQFIRYYSNLLEKIGKSFNPAQLDYLNPEFDPADHRSLYNTIAELAQDKRNGINENYAVQLLLLLEKVEHSRLNQKTLELMLQQAAARLRQDIKNMPTEDFTHAELLGRNYIEQVVGDNSKTASRTKEIAAKMIKDFGNFDAVITNNVKIIESSIAHTLIKLYGSRHKS